MLQWPHWPWMPPVQHIWPRGAPWHCDELHAPQFIARLSDGFSNTTWKRGELVARSQCAFEGALRRNQNGSGRFGLDRRGGRGSRGYGIGRGGYGSQGEQQGGEQGMGRELHRNLLVLGCQCSGTAQDLIQQAQMKQ